jgi:hypothetical protein
MSYRFGENSNFVTNFAAETPELPGKPVFWPMVQGLNSPIRQINLKTLK